MPEQRRKEIPPHVEIDAAPAGAVERPGFFRPAASAHKGRQMRRHAGAVHRAVEPAGHGQHRVANALGLQAAARHMMPQAIIGIGGHAPPATPRPTCDTRSTARSSDRAPSATSLAA